MIQVQWQIGMTLETVEKEVILQAMRYFKGNQTTTSQALGIAVNTLGNKLKKYKEDSESIEERNARITAEQQAWAYKQRHGHDGKAGRAYATPEPEHFEDFITGDLDGGGVRSSEEGSQPERRDSQEEREKASLPGADEGVRVESASVAPKEYAVPMSERKEVQGLPPRKVAVSGTNSRR